MITNYVGIDPGGSGAIAVLDTVGELQSVVDMPTLGGQPLVAEVAALLEAVATANDLFVTIEQPFVTRPPRASLATQFQHYGILLGILGTLGVKHHEITPVQWKGRVGLPMSSQLTSREKKTNSRLLSMELWPEWAQSFERVKDDGRAEACLIAAAGRLEFKGGDL